MPLLDAIKKPKQVAPASDNRFTSSYTSAWNTYNEHDKQNSFVHVPLSPPVNRYSRYYRYKNHLKDTDIEPYESDKASYRSTRFREKMSQENDKKELCTRLLCCCCFPCLPIWGRTLCCFIFLGICVLLGFMLVFMLAFKAPQMKLLGDLQDIQQQNGTYNFRYYIQNDNFLSFDLQNIRITAYYSDALNTIGVGELPHLNLRAQSAMNISVSMNMMTPRVKEINKNSSNRTVPHALAVACSSISEYSDVYPQKDLELSFDMMPTVKLFSYPIATVVFHGQKTTISCGEGLKGISSKEKVP